MDNFDTKSSFRGEAAIKKDLIGPTGTEMKQWLEKWKTRSSDTEVAFQHCFAGMKLFQALPEPKSLSFKQFMMKYLETAPAMDAQRFTIAWKMLDDDFGKHLHRN